MNETTARRLGSVLIVGAGNMGQAICAGLLRIPGMHGSAICMANPSKPKRELVSERYGVRTCADAREGLDADTVFLAVKPAVVETVCTQLDEHGIASARVVSVAAGVSTARIAACFSGPVPIVRVMPNTPLLVGEGMSCVSAGEHADDEDVELVRDVFAAMGKARVVPEDKLDVVTALSGSGPAYFELMCQNLAQSAADLGLDYGTACELAVQTMYGTAALVSRTGQSLPDAIEAVSSPGGTTVAALDAMRAAGFEQAVHAGVVAAEARSRELGA